MATQRIPKDAMDQALNDSINATRGIVRQHLRSEVGILILFVAVDDEGLSFGSASNLPPDIQASVLESALERAKEKAAYDL